MTTGHMMKNWRQPSILPGFGLTLGAWNVDGTIARQNIERGLRGEEFDRAYLAGLSTDAIPVLLDYYHQPGLESEIHDGIGAALACQAALLEDEVQPDWRSFTISRAAATRALTGEDWSAYAVEKSDGYYSVTVNGVREFCGGD